MRTQEMRKSAIPVIPDAVVHARDHASVGQTSRRSDGDGALVTIATYNEAENIGRLLDEIHRSAPKMHALVVDDNSPDGTGEYVESRGQVDRRIHVLRRPGKQGYGTAVVAGWRWGLERGYRAIGTMDADFSHDPAVLPELFGGLAEADAVIGSRYISGISVVNWPLWRLVLSLGANRYARMLTGIPVTDCTTGFRAFRGELLSGIPMERIRSNGYAFIMETNFWAHRLGGRIREMPIIYVDRRVGASKMDGPIVLEAIATPYRLWWNWLTYRARRSRLFTGV
jgi:dolichol-phosphate mannosyltransferase